MDKVRVLIAEDHATVCEGIKLILSAQSDIEVVGDADDGFKAIELARKLRPDVVLMDISMPRLNGLKATAKLKESCPEVHVLTLTRHKEDGYLQQILRAGASGYVLKQSSAVELVHAIRAVAKGGKYLDPSVAEKVLGSYAGRGSSLSEGHPDITDRETEVLRLIAWGHSNKDIANRLDLSVKTVEAHKTNGMKKLGMTSRIDIVRYAVLQGWLENA
ncbi:MAG TPA: response regulator transcription factor [Pyrinomonadaceae bacterium]|jgi:DNA-binding NarL/FixJ family response regulator|nr:response regulator transcription factor [Pyrinomonadaceae bacterium]